MKRTTYILFGMILSGLLVIIVGVIVVASLGEQRSANELFLGGKTITKELPPFRAVVVSQMNGGTTDQILRFDNCKFQVSSSETGKNVFSCPKDAMEYLSLKVQNDTLYLAFDYPADKLPEHMKGDRYIWISENIWGLQIAQNVDYIKMYDPLLRLGLQGLAQDTLSVDVATSVLVDSCRLASLSVCEARELNLQSGEIDKLYLDLDGIRNWKVDTEKLHLNTEYLTGSNSNVSLQKGECKQMFWIPKKEDSQLRVTLTERSCIKVDDK